MSIYKTEKELLIDQMWEIVFRKLGPIDDGGHDWLTIKNKTYVAEWMVSEEPEVAHLVNTINYFKGHFDLIDVDPAELFDEKGGNNAFAMGKSRGY